MSNWKLNFNLLKNKTLSKLKDFNNMDDSKLNDNYNSHFENILNLLCLNVRKSKGILILYTEVDYLRKIILNENGFIRKKYRGLMINYIQILCLLNNYISQLNGNLSKDFYNKLVEFFYYLSLEIKDYENGIVNQIEDSSVKSYKELNGLNHLDKELNKIRLIKNRSERESELSKWFLEGKGPNLKDLHLNKSVEEVLSEIQLLRDGKYLSNLDENISSNNLSEKEEEKVEEKIKEEFDVIDILEKKLSNPNLSANERSRLILQLERNKSFRNLLNSDLNIDNKNID